MELGPSVFSACAGASAPLCPTARQEPAKDWLCRGQLTDVQLQGDPALQRKKNKKVEQLDRSHFYYYF